MVGMLIQVLKPPRQTPDLAQVGSMGQGFGAVRRLASTLADRH